MSLHARAKWSGSLTRLLSPRRHDAASSGRGYGAFVTTARSAKAGSSQTSLKAEDRRPGEGVSRRADGLRCETRLSQADAGRGVVQIRRDACAPRGRGAARLVPRRPDRPAQDGPLPYGHVTRARELGPQRMRPSSETLDAHASTVSLEGPPPFAGDEFLRLRSLPGQPASVGRDRP